MSYVEPIIQTLQTYLNSHAKFKSDFQDALEEALRQAKTFGIKDFDGIQTIEDYLKFYNDLLKWVPVENETATVVNNKLCMFYFMLNFLPKEYQTPIAPGGGWTWLSQWLVDYAQELGKWLDNPESITRASIATFYESEDQPPDGYHMDDYVETDTPGGWTTFNRFFARKIKKDVRKVAPQDEGDNVIVSPADSTFKLWANVTANDTVEFIPDNTVPGNTVTVKGVPWSISELLQDTIYGERFKGGKFMHAFLSPTDYHRQHAPVSGRVVEAKVIPGLCYLHVAASEKGLEMRRLHMDDSEGYQFLQARGLVVIENAKLGLVAVLPIGMAQVSSVVLSVKAGDELKKGDEISYFQLGGSDVIVVFEAKANVDFSNTEKKWHAFGKRIAIANPLPIA